MRCVDRGAGGEGVVVVVVAELVWQFVMQLPGLYKHCLFVSSFYYALSSTRLLLLSDSPNIDPALLTQNLKA